MDIAIKIHQQNLHFVDREEGERCAPRNNAQVEQSQLFATLEAQFLIAAIAYVCLVLQFRSIQIARAMRE